MSLTLYLSHVVLDLRLLITILTVLVYAGLVGLAQLDQKKTVRSIATRREWSSARDAAWTEAIILLSLLVTLVNVTLILGVRQSSNLAQWLGTVAVLLLLARGILVVRQRRRSSRLLWQTGKPILEQQHRTDAALRDERKRGAQQPTDDALREERKGDHH